MHQDKQDRTEQQHSKLLPILNLPVEMLLLVFDYVLSIDIHRPHHPNSTSGKQHADDWWLALACRRIHCVLFSDLNDDVSPSSSPCRTREHHKRHRLSRLPTQNFLDGEPPRCKVPKKNHGTRCSSGSMTDSALTLAMYREIMTLLRPEWFRKDSRCLGGL